MDLLPRWERISPMRFSAWGAGRGEDVTVRWPNGVWEEFGSLPGSTYYLVEGMGQADVLP